MGLLALDDDAAGLVIRKANSRPLGPAGCWDLKGPKASGGPWGRAWRPLSAYRVISNSIRRSHSFHRLVTFCRETVPSPGSSDIISSGLSHLLAMREAEFASSCLKAVMSKMDHPQCVAKRMISSLHSRRVLWATNGKDKLGVYGRGKWR